MRIGEIREYLGKDWAATQSLMASALSSDVQLLDDTNRTVFYNSGKQMRPMISLLAARACGEPNERSYHYAAASEVLHNATLMHDDVADESGERRGKPTLASLLGPTAAVLVGDFWLAKAMNLLFDCGYDQNVGSLFSKTLVNLAEGEMLQIEKAESADTVEDDYFRIIYCKTASLFVAAAQSGAISVNACAEYVQAIRDYARYSGIAFQIKDDILDYSGGSQLGKPVGIDIKEKKITLPLLGALAGSSMEKEIRDMVRLSDIHPEYIDRICEFVRERNGIAYAETRLEEFVGKAVSALSPLPDSQAKEMLTELARYNSIRKL